MTMWHSMVSHRQLYVTALVLLTLVAADKDIQIPVDELSGCVESDISGNSECQGRDSFTSLIQGQRSPLPADTKDACERNCVNNDTSNSDSERVDSRDGQRPLPQHDFISKAPVQDRPVYSSQQATELLVSSWNDLSKWTARNDTSSVCQRDVEMTIQGFLSNELWALRMFDAWAKPGPSLLEGRSTFVGNYYQCRNVRADRVDKTRGFNGNYCVVGLVNLTHTANTNMFFMIALSLVQVGTCLPDTCSQKEVTELVQERLQALNLTPFLQAVSADCRTDDREYTTFTKIALLLVLVIGTLTFLGTVLDLTIEQFPQWAGLTHREKYQIAGSATTNKTQTGQMNGQDKTAQAQKDGKNVQEKQPKINNTGVWVKVLLSFSAYTNGRRFLSTSQAPGSLTAIPGIRFLTMSWIVIGHTYFLLIYGQANNILQGMETVVRYRIFDVMNSMHLGVDSFFTISGLLVSYLTVKRIMEKGWEFEWKHFFLHRYWRLTPTLMITFILVMGLQRFLVAGSAAPTVQPMDKEACENTWWHIPLYVSNLFLADMESFCFGHSWSLSADFQFYLLSPLMLIPFYYHKLAGVLSCLLFVVGQWLLAGIISYSVNGQIGMMSMSFEWFKHCYCPFYTRIAPFAVGILTGYILSVNNGRVKMSPTTVITGWLVAVTSATVVIFGFHGDVSMESPSSLLVTSLYNAFVRTVWGSSLCWVIVACSSGYGGPVNDFFSWSPFTVLGRLTYMGYLLQMSVSTVIFQNLEQLTHLSLFSLVVYGTIDLVFTCVVSAIFVICVEFPTFNLEKVIRGRE